MSYVPIVPYVPPPPSPLARALGKRLSEAIEDFRSRNPGVTRAEVHEALRLAETRTRPSKAVLLTLVAVTGLLVLGAMLLILFRAS